MKRWCSISNSAMESESRYRNSGIDQTLPGLEMSKEELFIRRRPEGTPPGPILPQEAVKTSAQIISEAKASISRGQGHHGGLLDGLRGGQTVKLVTTERPFTPKPRERHLYPTRGHHPSRPPSSSINLRLIEEEPSPRPTSSAGVRLAPLRNPSSSRSQSFDSTNNAVRSGPESILAFEGQPCSLQRSPSAQTRLPSIDGSKASLGAIKPSLSFGDGPLGASAKATKARQQFRKISRPKSASVAENQVVVEAPSVSRLNSIEGDALSKSLPGVQSVQPSSPDVGNLEIAIQQLKAAQDDYEVASYLENVLSMLADGSQISSVHRKAILKVASRHLAADNAAIIFPLVDVLLALKVTRTNLSMACKLLFKLAKDDTNDHFFKARRTIELCLSGLGRNCPMGDNEAFVYGYGALKFLTLNSKIVEHLENLGFIHLAILHLKVLCNLDEAKVTTFATEISNVTFQITSCLRNMMNAKRSKKTFAEIDGIRLILEVVDKFYLDVDVMCNVSRTLSVLSSEDQVNQDECLKKINASSGALVKAVYKILRNHGSRRDIVVRLTFCLGNLAANCDEARLILAKTEDTIKLLPQLLDKFMGEINEAQAVNEASFEENIDGTIEDTAIKIIRVWANVSINGEAGAIISLSEDVVDGLLAICHGQASISVLLPTLATLNNLSFYPLVHQVETYHSLKKFLRWEGQPQICAETARVFGNLSRRPEVRQCFLEDGEFAATVDYLAKGGQDLDRDLVYACVGIMVNMMSDPIQRPTFKQHRGLEACTMMLERCLDESDWSLASLVCQALWNFCIDSPDIAQCIESEDILADLEDVIVYLLEACNYSAHQRALEDQLIDEVVESLESEEREFCKVGLGLLKRLLDRDSHREFDLLLPTSGSDTNDTVS